MRGKWYGLGCLTSLILVILVFVLMVTGINSYFSKHRAEKKKIESGSWLELTVSEEMKEFSEVSEDFWGKKRNTAHNYILAVRSAADDDRITGLLIRPELFSAGYSTINQLISALEYFRTKGKPVYAYLNTTTNRGYYLASAADKIYLNPSSSAGIILTGIGGHILYYEQLLEKLGIDMQVIHAGKYKAAGEQFVLNEMSAEFRENLSELYRELYDQMLMEIAQNRGIEISELKKIYETRDNIWINGEYSLKTELVDELVQYQDLLDINNITKANKIDISDYPVIPYPEKTNKIGVLFAQGSITNQSGPAFDVITSQKIVKQLIKLESNPKIKAVVIRVNSPGGSALESDIILHEINKLQRSKPVVISMGDVAASGGYYISCGAEYIFADPMTITGSIGVVAIVPYFNKMGDKIGVNSSSISYGRFSDLLNIWEAPDNNEINALRSSIMEVYDEFKTRVSEGRNLTLNHVEEVAQGRVRSSIKAKENKLIDEVGRLEQAIEKAAELANVTSYSIDYYPEQKSLMDIFLKEYFDIEMAAQIVSGKLDYLDIVKEINLIKAIKENPRQAYCPIELD